LLESQAERIFIRSKYDKGYKYQNQEGMDAEISKYGILLKSPVFKRNCLQTIDTRRLTYEQKYAVKHPFNEMIDYISQTLEISL
jgi:chromosome partitioning protein